MAEEKNLITILPDKVFLPGSPKYHETTQAYFTAFAQKLAPTHVVRPSSADDVVKIVQFAQQTNAKLAIKGAGHTPWAGAASIHGGITVDMRDVRGIQLDEEKKVVSVYAGEKWGSVYEVLQAKGLATMGGRVTRVGVMGLTLGGGLSFFSGRHGFVCDAVTEFEVVLSTGEIVVANKSTNSDLFIALKGGSNNFGVVTRIDLPVFPQGPVWGGMTFYPGPAITGLLTALVNYATSSTPDEDVNTLVAFGWNGEYNMEMGAASLYHCDLPDGVDWPESLQEFKSLDSLKIQTTLRRDTVFAHAQEQGSYSKDGARNLYLTTSIKADLEFLLEVRKLLFEAVEGIKDVQGLAFSMVVQPLTIRFLENSAKSGGNTMGLSPDQGPFLNIIVNPAWKDEKDDDRIENVCLDLLKNIDELAVEREKYVRWRFVNYAYGVQNVMSSYGEASLQKMKEVSRKYDPSVFFQKNVPGGFKVDDDDL